MLHPLIPEQLVHQEVELLVMGEQDVAAQVPRESLPVHYGACQPAGLGGGLEQLPVAVLPLLQAVGGPQPGGTGADDDDSRLSHAGASSGTPAADRGHARRTGSASNA